MLFISYLFILFDQQLSHGQPPTTAPLPAHSDNNIPAVLYELAEPPDFDLDAYIARELTFPIGGTIRLVLLFGNKADVQRLEEAPVSVDQEIVARKDGMFELAATVEDTLQLHWWLRGYGTRVEVIAPESLRKEFAEMSLKLSERYSNAANR
jgi:predicted DNA-binding transcriptional regulator YafY